jgi:hypothetical protein
MSEEISQLEREWREGITRNIETLAQAQRVTQEAVAALKADMMPRQEVSSVLERYVSADVYSADKAAVDSRITHLEHGPMRFVNGRRSASQGWGVLSVS